MRTEPEDDEEQKEQERQSQEEEKEKRYREWTAKSKLPFAFLKPRRVWMEKMAKKQEKEEERMTTWRWREKATMPSSFSSSGESAGCLSAPLRAAIVQGIRALEQDPRCVYIVITSCSPHLFSLGVNTYQFTDGVLEKPTVEELCQVVVCCSKITIAAIMGKCFSWGFELALCTTYRIGVEHGTWCSFPEAKLSLLPASLTGILALVKRAGVPSSVQLLGSGKVLSATVAHQQYGVLDGVWRGDEPMRPWWKIPTEENPTEETMVSSGGATRTQCTEALEPPPCVSEREGWWNEWMEMVQRFAAEKIRLSATSASCTTREAMNRTLSQWRRGNRGGNAMPMETPPLEPEPEEFCSSHHYPIEKKSGGPRRTWSRPPPPSSPPRLPPYPDPITLSLFPSHCVWTAGSIHVPAWAYFVFTLIGFLLLLQRRRQVPPWRCLRPIVIASFPLLLLHVGFRFLPAMNLYE